MEWLVSSMENPKDHILLLKDLQTQQKIFWKNLNNSPRMSINANDDTLSSKEVSQTITTVRSAGFVRKTLKKRTLLQWTIVITPDNFSAKLTKSVMSTDEQLISYQL